MQRAAVGFAMSVVVGVAIGVALAASPLLRRAFGPIITGLQSLPSVAWVPAAIIWFQLTDATMYAVILLGAVPSIVNGLLAGTDQVPPLYLRVGQVLGATGWTRIRFVLLPAALPGFLGGLKQGWAFAWRSLMAAELIVQTGLGTGLGQILDLGRVTSDMSLVIASIGLIFLVGIVIELVVFAPLERHVLHSRGPDRAGVVPLTVRPAREAHVAPVVPGRAGADRPPVARRDPRHPHARVVQGVRLARPAVGQQALAVGRHRHPALRRAAQPRGRHRGTRRRRTPAPA